MAWVRIDDHFNEHPKLAAVGPLGWALWAVGLAYCNRNLTDGFIPWAVAKTLVSWEFLEPICNGGGNAVTNKVVTVAVTSGYDGDDVTCEYVIGLLVGHGVWEKVEGGYRVHDYLDYQPSKVQVQKSRESTKKRVGEYRKRNASSNGVSNGHVTPAPNPNPKYSLSKKKERGAVALVRLLGRESLVPIAQELDEYRRQKGLSIWVPKTVESKAKEWGQFNDEELSRAMRDSINEGWQGVFPKHLNGKDEPGLEPID